MKIGFKLTIAAVALCVAQPGFAGFPTKEGTSPDSRWLYVHTSIPAICHDEFLRARDQLDGTNVRFDLYQASSWIRNLYTYEANNLDVQVEPRGLWADTDPNSLAITWWNWRPGGPPWVLQDMDVIVNNVFMYDGNGGAFWCGDGNAPSDKIDFQRVITHEFGHVAGMGHVPAGQDSADHIMYTYTSPGPQSRVYHPHDRQILAEIYPF